MFINKDFQLHEDVDLKTCYLDLQHKKANVRDPERAFVTYFSSYHKLVMWKILKPIFIMSVKFYIYMVIIDCRHVSLPWNFLGKYLLDFKQSLVQFYIWQFAPKLCGSWVGFHFGLDLYCLCSRNTKNEKIFSSVYPKIQCTFSIVQIFWGSNFHVNFLITLVDLFPTLYQLCWQIKYLWRL